MILFRGNCQMQFCAEAATAAGLPAGFASLASPVTLARSPGFVPPLLAKMIAAAGVGEYLHTRELADQFLPPPESPRPDVLVVNLFHENTPLFLHEREGHAFYIDPRALDAAPAFGRFIKRHYRAIAPNPATYLDRLANMLLAWREALPDIPLIVCGRMSHFPGLGPSPHSYLQGWGEACFDAGREFAAWAADLPGVRYLDADRIMAGVMARSGTPVEAHFPFLRVRPADDGALAISRDLEHAGGLWPAIVAKVEEALETGQVAYAPDEAVPASWDKPFAPERLDEAAMLPLLISGSNYKAARAVGQFFFRPETDFTELLVTAAPYMPVCHNLLSMVRAYGRWRKNPVLAGWCEAHARTAATFTANGEAYREEYLGKIEDLARMLLAPGTV
ncbi:conserved hypothetical protein [Solidesulfovibrio fructosivorans JJ]]|uniref:Uncharacterized protein n=1 Tax=Solidesulfovibrio fructosivorans JJ] TaxID=596151 RepID=E1JWB8_SOLFR|nr:hypothetical protein [Solidesulfovibrio fructosivorans]EFL51215.1 conserved hypothetical protein [Solidesulfovibrio fructosivorans JJ]]